MKLVMLALNRRYQVKGGAVIPRSHFNEMDGVELAIIQIDTEIDGRVVTSKKLETRSGLKKLMGFKKGWEVEIE